MADQVMLLSQVHGDGRITFRALAAAGFDTLAAIKETEVQVLADRARLSMPTAERLKLGALEMSDNRSGNRSGNRSDNGSGNKKGSRPGVKHGTSPRSRARRSPRGRVAGRAAKAQVPPFGEGILSEEAALLSPLLSQGSDPQTRGAAHEHALNKVDSGAVDSGSHTESAGTDVPRIEDNETSTLGDVTATVTASSTALTSDGILKPSGGYWSFG